MTMCRRPDRQTGAYGGGFQMSPPYSLTSRVFGPAAVLLMQFDSVGSAVADAPNNPLGPQPGQAPVDHRVALSQDHRHFVVSMKGIRLGWCSKSCSKTLMYRA